MTKEDEVKVEEEVVVVVFTRENRGVSAQHATRATPTRSSHEPMSLALCHPYPQLCCSVHPHHPACAQQNGENFPIGADPSGSFFASSYRKGLPIVRLCLVILRYTTSSE